jgi:hypothetical protein
LALSGWNEIFSPRIFFRNCSGSQVSLSLNFPTVLSFWVIAAIIQASFKFLLPFIFRVFVEMLNYYDNHIWQWLIEAQKG